MEPRVIPTSALTWFERLSADNSRAFWAVNRDAYERDVRQPFVALLDALPGAPEGWRVYRPHQDTRFRPDTPPLKDFIGAVAPRTATVGTFVRLDVRGLLVATGAPDLESDQLARYRVAVADEVTGSELETVIADARAAGLRVHHGRPEPLARVPRGFSADHPRAELLRWKGVETGSRFGADALGGTDLVARITAVLAAAAPVDAWLETHVGPSARTPEERWSRGPSRR